MSAVKPLLSNKCKCQKCYDEKMAWIPAHDGNFDRLTKSFDHWQYVCEICGQHECQHRADHNAPCIGKFQ